MQPSHTMPIGAPQILLQASRRRVSFRRSSDGHGFAPNPVEIRRTLGLALEGNESELPLDVRIEGLAPSEQRAALRAFPGGSRFSIRS